MIDPVFHIEERTVLDGRLALDVLEGRLAGAIFRNVASHVACEQIVSRFWCHEARQQRSAEALGSYVGALHWMRPMDQLMAEVPFAQAAIDTILNVENEPCAQFIKAVMASDSTLTGERPARYKGQPVCPRVIRSWADPSLFALRPHEDRAQTLWPAQQGFEINQVEDQTLCALNVCLENEGGGELHLWDLRPSPQIRRDLGIEFEGIPYPFSLLTDKEHLVIPIRKGDIYVFNGAFVHAVASPLSAQDKRTTVSCLMSLSSRRELLQWT